MISVTIRIIAITVFLISFVSPVYAQTDINAGIVKGAWFSQLPVFVEDNFQVKTAFHNNSGSDIVSRATFFDNGTEIHSYIFEIKDSKLIEVKHDLVGEYGDHQYTIQIEVYKKTEGESENLEIDGDLLLEQTVNTFEIFIDHDTDGDGVGNLDDEDDDNDGVLDEDDDDPLNAPPNPAEKVIKEIQDNTTNLFAKVNNFTEEFHQSLQEKVVVIKDDINTLKTQADTISGTQIGDELIVLTSDQEEELKDINNEKRIKTAQLALLATAMTLFSNQWFFWIGIIIISYLIFLFLRKIVRRYFRNI